MLKISGLIALGALLSASVPLTISPADRDSIMRAAPAHLAGEQSFGHRQAAGRRSCVARELIPFREPGAAMMADDKVVTNLNVTDGPVRLAEPTSAQSEGPVDPAWLRPNQVLADANGSCAIAISDVISISPPTLDATDRARVYFSLICGGLCGTGEVLVVERKSGAWQVTGREQLWVS